MPSECKIHCMLRCTSGCCADADLVVESFEVETGPRVFLSIMFSFEPLSALAKAVDMQNYRSVLSKARMFDSCVSLLGA